MKIFILFIAIILSTTCFSQQSNFEFYSKFTTEFNDKDTLAFLNSIESKIRQRVRDIAVGKSNLNITACDAEFDNWLVPITFKQITHYDSISLKLSTNKYETFLVWNNYIDTVQIIGFARDYKFAPIRYYSDTNNLTRPICRIPLSDYSNIIDNSDYDKIKILLLKIMSKKFKMTQKDSATFIYSFKINKDSLILNQASYKLFSFLFHDLQAYSNTDFLKLITYNQVKALTQKPDTIVDNGLVTTIYSVSVVNSIKVYEELKMIKYSEKNDLDVPYFAPIYTFVQKVKAIGLVYDTGAELIYDISDIKNAALKSRIDFNPYEEVFKSYSMNYFNIRPR
jgi:hypothetical protein